MKKITSIEEATAHFNESVDPILCTADGKEPQVAHDLSQAREYYEWEEEQVPAPPSDPKPRVANTMEEALQLFTEETTPVLCHYDGKSAWIDSPSQAEWYYSGKELNPEQYCNPDGSPLEPATPRE